MAKKRQVTPDIPPAPDEHSHPCSELQALQLDSAEVKADVGNFKEWQLTQNGTLLRIEAKVDHLMWRIIAGMGGLALILIGFVIEEAVRH